MVFALLAGLILGIILAFLFIALTIFILFKTSSTPVPRGWPYVATPTEAARISDLLAKHTIDSSSLEPVFHQGWATLRRRADAPPAASSFLSGWMPRKPLAGRGQQAVGTYWLVLKQKILFAYADERMEGSALAAIDVGRHRVSMFPYDQDDGDYFIKKNWIRLDPIAEVRTSASAESMEKGAGLEGAGEDDEGGAGGMITDDVDNLGSALSLPFFLTVSRNIDKEDWYLSLKSASQNGHPDSSTLFAADKLLDAREHHAFFLNHELDATPELVSLRALNAFIGTIWFKIFRTSRIHDYAKQKFETKFARIRNSAVDNFRMLDFHVGDRPPLVWRPLVKEATETGATTVEIGVRLPGEINCRISFDLTIKAAGLGRVFRVVVDVKMRNIEGTIRARIKEGKSNRLWWGFVETPNIEIEVVPVLWDSRWDATWIKGWLGSQYLKELKDSCVLPNMEDLVFFPTTGYNNRGGLFGEMLRDPSLPTTLPRPFSSATATGSTEKLGDLPDGTTSSASSASTTTTTGGGFFRRRGRAAAAAAAAATAGTGTGMDERAATGPGLTRSDTTASNASSTKSHARRTSWFDFGGGAARASTPTKQSSTTLPDTAESRADERDDLNLSERQREVAIDKTMLRQRSTQSLTTAAAAGTATSDTEPALAAPRRKSNASSLHGPHQATTTEDEESDVPPPSAPRSPNLPPTSTSTSSSTPVPDFPSALNTLRTIQSRDAEKLAKRKPAKSVSGSVHGRRESEGGGSPPTLQAITNSNSPQPPPLAQQGSVTAVITADAVGLRPDLPDHTGAGAKPAAKTGAEAEPREGQKPADVLFERAPVVKTAEAAEDQVEVREEEAKNSVVAEALDLANDGSGGLPPPPQHPDRQRAADSAAAASEALADGFKSSNDLADRASVSSANSRKTAASGSGSSTIIGSLAKWRNQAMEDPRMQDRVEQAKVLAGKFNTWTKRNQKSSSGSTSGSGATPGKIYGGGLDDGQGGPSADLLSLGLEQTPPPQRSSSWKPSQKALDAVPPKSATKTAEDVARESYRDHRLKSLKADGSTSSRQRTISAPNGNAASGAREASMDLSKTLPTLAEPPSAVLRPGNGDAWTASASGNRYDGASASTSRPGATSPTLQSPALPSMPSSPAQASSPPSTDAPRVTSERTAYKPASMMTIPGARKDRVYGMGSDSVKPVPAAAMDRSQGSAQGAKVDPTPPPASGEEPKGVSEIPPLVEPKSALEPTENGAPTEGAAGATPAE